MISDPAMAVLNNAVDYMEEQGVSRKEAIFNVDEKLVNKIYDATGIQYSINGLEIAANECFALNLIERQFYDAKKYGSLVITEEGIYAAKLEKKHKLERINRPVLKKMSDHFADYDGLFSPLNVLIALVSLIITLALLL